MNESEEAEPLLVKFTLFPLITVPGKMVWSLLEGSVKTPLAIVIILKISGIVPSGSVPSNMIIVDTFSVTVTVFSVAIGESFTWAIVMAIEALLLSEKPS